MKYTLERERERERGAKRASVKKIDLGFDILAKSLARKIKKVLLAKTSLIWHSNS